MKPQSNSYQCSFLQARRSWTSDPLFLPWLSWQCFVHGETACANTVLFQLLPGWELLYFLPFCIFLERSSEKLNNQQESQEEFSNFSFIHFAMYLYAGHKWYIEEQWRARLLWHFPLPPEQVQSPSFFTNDILRLETETLSQLMFRFELQERPDVHVSLSLKQSLQCTHLDKP